MELRICMEIMNLNDYQASGGGGAGAVGTLLMAFMLDCSLTFLALAGILQRKINFTVFKGVFE